MPDLHLIVFSKDRPLQLHGYLTSLFEQWHGDFTVDVLVKSEPPYDAAYQEAVGGFACRRVRPEYDFSADLEALLCEGDAPLTCFGTDDAVFVSQVSVGALWERFEAEPALLGVSFRLGQTIRRGMFGQSMPQPLFLPRSWAFHGDEPPAALCWDATAADSREDWAYPWDVVGTVYRTSFVKRMVEALVSEGLADNPSHVEHHGAQRWQRYAEGATLLRAWHRPRLVLPTVNVVQSTFGNGVVGSPFLDAPFLLECWNRGLRLDTWRYAMGPQPDTWRVGELYLRRAA